MGSSLIHLVTRSSYITFLSFNLLNWKMEKMIVFSQAVLSAIHIFKLNSRQLKEQIQALHILKVQESTQLDQECHKPLSPSLFLPLSKDSLSYANKDFIIWQEKLFPIDPQPHFSSLASTEGKKGGRRGKEAILSPNTRLSFLGHTLTPRPITAPGRQAVIIGPPGITCHP